MEKYKDEDFEKEIEDFFKNKNPRELLKEQQQANYENTIDQLIKYCRYLNEERKKDPVLDPLYVPEASGNDVIAHMLQQGQIKPWLYMHISYLVNNPGIDYIVSEGKLTYPEIINKVVSLK